MPFKQHRCSPFLDVLSFPQWSLEFLFAPFVNSFPILMACFDIFLRGIGACVLDTAMILSPCLDGPLDIDNRRGDCTLGQWSFFKFFV